MFGQNKMFTYIEEPKVDEEFVCGMKFNLLKDDKGISTIDEAPGVTEAEEPKKKKGRPSKKKNEPVQFVPADENAQLPKYQSNEMYNDSYNETNMLLKGTIMQVDVLQNEIKSDIDSIRSSRTIKKKYDYISMLSSTASTLIGTKVSAIKEINKVITDSHNLELKRMKELKINEANVDDDKRMMDMYQAFISTPVGNGGGGMSMLGPSISDMTLQAGISNMVRADLGDSGFDGYQQNMSPAQNMMRMENNQDVKTVVVYDSQSGRRWFDVMNIRTGESVPNVNTPDAMFLDDTTIDVRNGIARNTNLDLSYPLIVLNNSNLQEY